MTFLTLILRSISYYWKSHLMIILGAAISTMVITGTLIVGDSVRFSLEKTTELRIGKTAYSFSGNDRFFRSQLAADIREQLNIDIAPLLQIKGIASAQGGKFKLNNIQVLGIDEHFAKLIPGGNTLNPPANNEAYISQNLSHRLQLKIGDSFLLRVEKVSQVPKNAPFVSNEDNYISLRLKVGDILSSNRLGRFNLNISQTAPFNIFLPISFLNEKMEMADKSNRLLISGETNTTLKQIHLALDNAWNIEDMALGIFQVNNGTDWEIRSERIFIDSLLANTVKQIAPTSDPILTYMANSIEKEGQSTPYSFVSAGPFSDALLNKNEIIINSWIAEDLNASVGDSIDVSYFSIGPLRKLNEENQWFIIKEVVPIEGIYAEQELMPDLPGLSDAGSCREWEAGVPISLDAIRDKDEVYWNKFRGTPKAFISYEAGKYLWENRFGVCTAIRISANNVDKKTLETKLASNLSPGDFGFSLKSIRDEGLAAARGGVDFSQLFMGLSFFLLVAGLILLGLLFSLHLENRIREIGTLKALGFPSFLIKRSILYEGFIIAIPGIILGGLLAILYNKLIFYALNTVWYEVVLTSVLQESIQLTSLLTGMGIAMVLVGTIIWYNTYKKLKASSMSLQRKLSTTNQVRYKSLYKISEWAILILTIGLIVYDILNGASLNTGIFFTAGTLMLIAFLLLLTNLIKSNSKLISETFDAISLISKNISRFGSRSLRIIILFALGTFIVISTGLNKKDLFSNANQQNSGTGGFRYYMETTLPILNDLNDPEIQADQGIDIPLNFVQMRKSEGDDASCLNLNRVTSPRILGIPPDQLEGRFSFVQHTEDLNLEHPWASLKNELPGQVIPAILDQTVILWGLGKEVGDTLIYKNEMGQEIKLKIIGGLANSIFQGNVLIDENHFLENYPSSSGSHVFLLDGKLDENPEEIIARAFRNDGIELSATADRLAMFNQVENTYLSIFLLLGGLAMILGTVGLGISLARNILDRGQEIGILRAIGFQKKSIFSMISIEYLFLLVTGTFVGAGSAFIATLPSFVSGIIQNSWQTALIILVAIILNGFAWIWLITHSYLKKNLLESLRSE